MSHTSQQKCRTPSVLIIISSDARGIKKPHLTTAAEVSKLLCYTLDETLEYINKDTDQVELDAIVLHALTNDLKSLKAEAFVYKLYILCGHILQKWPTITFIISFTAPRVDNYDLNTQAQLINVLIKEKVCWLQMDLHRVTISCTQALIYVCHLAFKKATSLTFFLRIEKEGHLPPFSNIEKNRLGNPIINF